MFVMHSYASTKWGGHNNRHLVTDLDWNSS